MAAPPAFAHGAFEDVAPFWSGALHLLVSPLSLALCIGLACCLVPVRPRHAVYSWLVLFGAAFLVSALGLVCTLPVPAFVAICLGAIAIVQARQPLWLLISLGLVSGVSAASAAAPDTSGILTGAGLGLALLLLSVGTYEGLVRLPTALRLAPRVLGSWVAAIGLLLAALAVASGQS